MHGRGAAPLARRFTLATTTGRAVTRTLFGKQRRMATATATATATTAATPLPPLGVSGQSTNPLPSFLRLIAAVNKGVGAIEREGLVRLVVAQPAGAADAVVGHVRPEFLPTLLAADAPATGGGGALVPSGGGGGAGSGKDAPRRPPASIALHPSLATPGQRTAAMAKTAASLRDRGVVSGWRGEPYPIFGDGAAWSPSSGAGDGEGAGAGGGGPLFEVERAVVPWLGARAFGVHVNGYVASPGGGGRPAAVWVARRSRSKPTWPGMLDHLAAGGQPAGMGAAENAVKEAWEEAGVPREMCCAPGGGGGGNGGAGGLRPVGTVTYRGLSSEGLKPDTLFVFDLELPADFVPEPQDGEVEAFELWSVARVREALATAGPPAAGDAGNAADAVPPPYPPFKPNVAVVMIDFLVRHGFVGPDTGPEYAEVVARLRQ